ncbi:MAG TPA: hypothetical protein DEH27_05445 [Deltaproteobacteria bacterium]|nr:hypothetical protein [Deltaproteobacteria bacterium]
MPRNVSRASANFSSDRRDHPARKVLSASEKESAWARGERKSRKRIGDARIRIFLKRSSPVGNPETYPGMVLSRIKFLS